MSEKYKICSECDGTGFSFDECSVCGSNRGWVYVNNNPDEGTEVCPECNGESGTECTECEGYW